MNQFGKNCQQYQDALNDLSIIKELNQYNYEKNLNEPYKIKLNRTYRTKSQYSQPESIQSNKYTNTPSFQKASQIINTPSNFEFEFKVNLPEIETKTESFHKNESSKIINTDQIYVDKIEQTYKFHKIESQLNITKNRLQTPIKRNRSLTIKNQIQRQNKIIEDLKENQSPQNDFIDQETNNQTKFYKVYKQIDKVQEQYKVAKKQKSIASSILLAQQQKNILPSALGLYYKNNKLKMNNFKFGDKYIECFSTGFQKMYDVKEARFDNNRISQSGANKLLESLNPYIENLNLASNNIGLQGCQHLSKYLQQKNIDLIFLNLEDNKLQDQNVNVLIQGLLKNNTLTKLNLSKNQISDKSIKNLCQVLENNQLQELYLHWNKITSEAKNIFRVLQNNKSLKVLDISWNEIGIKQCTQEIEKFLIQNKSLVHLDLSNNNFNFKQSLSIAKALEQNNTIFGFHFGGNYGKVDTNGFLKVTDQIQQNQHPNIYRIDGIKPSKLRKGKIYQEIPDQQLCWICDGWQQQKFEWNENDHPVFMHLEIDDYEGKYIGIQNKSERMVPHQEFFYFFTIDEQQCILQNQNNVETILEQEQKILIQNQITSMVVQQRNIKDYEDYKPILDQNYNPLINIYPRQKQQWYIPQKNEQIIKKFKIKKSIFKDYIKPSDDLLQNCFEFDWSNNKIYKLVKDQNDLQLLRNHFKQNYLLYVECYKCYAMLSPINDVFAISAQPFQIFIQSINIIDNNLSQNDVNLKWAATTQSMIRKDNFRNPERGIVRYQFIEVLTRLAEQKYIKSGICENYSDAMIKLFNEFLESEFIRCSTNQWRIDYFWNTQCDSIIQKNKQLFENIFQIISLRTKKVTYKPFISLDDYLDFCRVAEIYLNERDLTEIFAKSMMIQINELNFDRHQQMYFLEFIEAIGRIVYQIQDSNQLAENIEKFMISLKDKFEDQSQINWTQEQKKIRKISNLNTLK